MNLQVLVSTMHQKNYNLIKRMNIQTDAIIINQCEENKFEEFEYEGHSIKFLSFNERGVGLSRNNAIMRATAEICLFADDDVRYVDGYKKIIIDSFKKNPTADIIIFNVLSDNPKRPTQIIKKKTRLHLFNYMKYGSVRIAVRREKIVQSNICFHLLFGGGAKYACGEDVIFLNECIKKKLVIYAIPKKIGIVKQENSTWFDGYNDKFFKDKGVLFYTLSKKWSLLLCLQFALRRRKFFKESKTTLEAFKLMLYGIRNIKKLKYL